MPKSIHALTDKEIDDYFYNNKKFAGVFSKDELPKLKPNKFYIINMQNHEDPGTHWVYLDTLRPNFAYYFDSFGIPPPEVVKDRVHESGRQGIMSGVQLQELGTETCGYMCILIAEERIKGKKFKDILQYTFHLNNPKANEIMIKSLFVGN